MTSRYREITIFLLFSPGSGTIERDELKAVLLACIEESSLSLTDENLDDLTDVLFDAADADESGSITFEELQAELEKHPGVIENLTIRFENCIYHIDIYAPALITPAPTSPAILPKNSVI